MLTGRLSTRWFERPLLLIALACLGFCAWTWLDSGFYQLLQGRRLDGILGKAFGDSRHRDPAETTATTRAEIKESGLIGRIEIPRLGVLAMVAEGTNPRTLRRAVGHLYGTALPGEPGNVALAGHRDSFFSRLRNVRPGDLVRMTTPDGVFEYRVDAKGVVGPDRTDVLAPSDAPTLTLITCYPFQYVGAAPDRFIVRARQVAASRTSISSRTAGWPGWHLIRTLAGI